MHAHRTLFAVALAALLCAGAQEPAGTDARVRVKTARSLAKSGSEVLPQLTPLLKDPVVDVRREAVRSIASIGTQYSLDPLVAATRDNDPEIQFRAVEGLVNFYLPGYVEAGTFQRLGSAVRSRFDRENTQIIDPYVNVRADVIQALARLTTGGSSMEVRAEAARGIGVLRGRAALPALVDALKTKDSSVLYESLISIQKIRDPEAGPRVRFLLRDLDGRVQIAAIETVGLLKTSEAVGDLQRVYRESSSDKVRRSSLGALAMIADPSSRTLFRDAMTQKSDGERAAAAEGFARLKDASERAVIEKAFADEKKMAPRLANAFALVSLGQTDTGEMAPLSYLVNTLNSKNYRDVARPYLIELARDGKVRTAIYGYLRQGTRDEKVGVMGALAASGDRGSVPHIEALTKDPDPEVAQEAIRALRNLQARLG